MRETRSAGERITDPREEEAGAGIWRGRESKCERAQRGPVLPPARSDPPQPEPLPQRLHSSHTPAAPAPSPSAAAAAAAAACAGRVREAGCGEVVVCEGPAAERQRVLDPPRPSPRRRLLPASAPASPRAAQPSGATPRQQRGGVAGQICGRRRGVARGGAGAPALPLRAGAQTPAGGGGGAALDSLGW